MKGIIALSDGFVLHGSAFGYNGTSTGEVVFNTSITGYEEILTDPSYYYQIVTMTVSEVGNYGITLADEQSPKPQVAGFIIHNESRIPSNYRSKISLNDYLKENKVVGLKQVDTRTLTRYIRSRGAMKGCISTEIGTEEEAIELAQKARDIVGIDLSTEVTTKKEYEYSSTGDVRIVVIDCGVKKGILENLKNHNAKVSVLPKNITPKRLNEINPDGVVFSNGPGDPEPINDVIELSKKVLLRYPTLGICLGHQILCLALSGKTFKLKFGHRGGNQPVKNLLTNKVEITAQNHGFAVDYNSVKDKVVITHINLNDSTVEGMKHKDLPVFSLQYHPEACPGPNDAKYIFSQFINTVRTYAKKK
ncbi:MAG: glutamine-hydrolyzing carbamoyl-phosphate synthase small subunit [Candidatus Hydrogenedentota bacterium]